MARRRDQAGTFPGPLREFVESEWPPVEGECLADYACRYLGYGVACAPPPEGCGAALRASLADRPDLLAYYAHLDAYRRWTTARLSWLGRGHPLWFDTWLEGQAESAALRQAWLNAHRSGRGRDLTRPEN